MTHALARRAAAPKPGAPARKPSPRANAALPAYLKSGVSVVRPDAPAEQEAESVARTVAGGGTAFGAGRDGGAALARAPQLPAKPEEKKKPEEPVKKAAKSAEPEKKPEEPVKKAGKAETPAGPEKKDEPVKKAAKSAEPEKKPEEPVKKAGKAETPAGPEKKDDPVKKAAKAAEPEKKPAEPVKRAEKAPGAEGVEDKMKMPVARLARDDAGPEVDETAVREEEPVARKGDRESEAAAPKEEPSLALAAAAAAPGRPLAEDTRGVLEERLGADLGHVRVHDDRAAQDAAEALAARAYTQGADIYLGQGESERDVELIAHEVTHVLQNDAGAALPPVGGEAGAAAEGGEAAAAPVMRAPGPGTAPADGTYDYGDKGTITPSADGKSGSATIPKLGIPGFKIPEIPAPAKLSKQKRKAATAGKPGQGAAWDSYFGKNGLQSQLQGLAASQAGAQPIKDDGKDVYFFKLGGAKSTVFGNLDDVSTAAARPRWSKGGGAMVHDVDHRKELQLGGDHSTGDLSNFWLIDSATNQRIGGETDVKIREALTALQEAARPDLGPKTPGYDALRYVYDVTFTALAPSGSPAPASKFTKEDIAGGESLKPMEAMNAKEIEDVRGKADKLLIYGQASGGVLLKELDWPADAAAGAPVTLAGFKLPPFDVKSVNVGADGSGTMQVERDPAHKKFDPEKKNPGSVPLKKIAGLRNAVAIDKYSLVKSISLDLANLSPVVFDELDVTAAGVMGRGHVLPTVSLFQKVPLDIVLAGDDIFMEATIASEDIKLGKPIEVLGSSLTISASKDNIGVKGAVEFGIDKVGRGRLAGGGSIAGGFAVEGAFEFDKSLASDASGKVWYKGGAFGGSGHLGIGPDKIKGVKSGSLDFTFGEGTITADGKVETSIPKVKEAKIGASYSEKTGFTIGGEVSLEELPGLNAVKLTATAEQVDGGWSLNASGTITPNIPGITTSITGTYKDGIFLADGKLKFNKGKLAGDFRVVVTNGPVPGGEGGATDGGGAAPSAGGDAGAGGGELAVWGRGSATLKITDWLQGKATLALEPDGNVKVDGEISTPGAIELWKGKSFDHEIFKLGVDIPILGFSVAGQRVGVFANITGGAGIHASIGPVQLKDAKLGVAYDFATDMITSVSGHALIDCPAEAGLNLFIRAGIGVGAPIISAQGGLKASADVGVKGGISQELTVDWTPQAGLKIDTTAKAVMKPSLTLTLSGFCLVEADLLVKTVTLYEQEWKLAGFEVGSDLEFGVEFPVKYEEGKSFDVSLSDIKFITPDIDGGKLAKGAMDAVV